MKWNNLSTEETVVKFVLAHIAQFDLRLYLLKFTTVIITRDKFLPEVSTISNMKRKLERDYYQ